MITLTKLDIGHFVGTTKLNKIKLSIHPWFVMVFKGIVAWTFYDGIEDQESSEDQMHRSF